MRSSKKIKLKGIFRTLLLIFCGAVLGVNVYLFNANRLVGDQIPMPFGYGAAVVLSGSMEPALSKGDLIIVRAEEAYAAEDIVVFQQEGSLVVHRIMSFDGDSVITKGDANNTEDAPVDRSVIKGKVLVSVPAVGHAVSFLKTPAGIACVLVAAVALLEIPRFIERKQDDDDRQLLLEEIERLKKEKREKGM